MSYRNQPVPKYHRSKLLVLLILLPLMILACMEVNRLGCITAGHRWTGSTCVEDTSSSSDKGPPAGNDKDVPALDDEGNPGTNEEGAAAPAIEGDLPLEQCLVPPTDYNWKYEVSKQSREAQGGFCYADIVLTNTSDNPIFIMANEISDNNAMESSIWFQWSLEPGENRIEDTSYAWRRMTKMEIHLSIFQKYSASKILMPVYGWW